MKILNTIVDFTEDAKPVLDALGEVAYVGAMSQEEFERSAPEYDVWLIRLGVRATKELIGRSPNLRVIATATTGLDHIDLDAAEARGIEIVSLRGETSFLDTITSTAELAWSLVLDLARLNPWAFSDVLAYKWELEKFRGRSLNGKTLGVLGLGRLGRLVAGYGKAFGMDVVYHDPQVAEDPTRAHEAALNNFHAVDFDALAREADILSIHVHLSQETHNMFNEAVFKQMKKNALLINTSRGKIVNEHDLINALENKELAGYGTDVLDGEAEFVQAFSNHPLVEYAKKNQNCIILPHTGGLTHESRHDTDVFIAEKMRNFLEKG